MKFDLDEKETDIVMNSLAAQPWRVANPVISKMMAQANDPQFQGTAKEDPPADPAEGATNG